jgi:CHAT domain-containing protein
MHIIKLKIKFVVLFVYILSFLSVSSGQTQESNVSYSNFYNYFTIYLDNFEKIGGKIINSPDSWEEIKVQITEKVDIAEQGEVDMNSLAMWHLLLMVTGMNIENSQIKMIEISNFLVETEYFLDQLAKLEYDKNYETDVYYNSLSDIYFAYAVLKSASKYSDLWDISPSSSSDIKRINPSSSVLSFYEKSLKATEQSDFKNILVSKISETNDGNVIIEKTGIRKETSQYIDDVYGYTSPASVLLGLYEQIGDKSKYDILKNKVFFLLENISQLEEYRDFSVDEIYVFHVMNYFSNEFVEDNYSAKEYEKILLNYEKKLEKLESNPLVSSFSFYEKLFNFYLNVGEQEKALNSFKKLYPYISDKTVITKANLFNSFLNLQLTSPEDYSDWSLMIDNISTDALASVPEIKESGFLGGIDLLISIHNIINLRQSEDLSIKNTLYLENARDLYHDIFNTKSAESVFLDIRIESDSGHKSNLDYQIGLFEEWRSFDNKIEFIFGSNVEQVISTYLNGLFFVHVYADDLIGAKKYLNLLGEVSQGRMYYGAYAEYCYLIDDTKCVIDSYIELAKHTDIKFNNLIHENRLIEASTFATQAISEYFTLSFLLNEEKREIKEIFYYQDKAIQHIINKFEIANSVESFLVDSNINFALQKKYKYDIDDYLTNFFLLSSSSLSQKKLEIDFEYRIKDEDQKPIRYWTNKYLEETYPIVKVKNISKESIFYKAGIRKNDIIVKINNNDLYATSIFDLSLHRNFEHHLFKLLNENQINKVSFIGKDTLMIPFEGVEEFFPEEIEIFIDKTYSESADLNSKVYERAFYITQLLSLSEASSSLNKFADRIINFDGIDSAVIKKRQDLKKEMIVLSDSLYASELNPNTTEFIAAKDELELIQYQLFEIDQKIGKQNHSRKDIIQKIYTLDEISNYLENDEFLIINFDSTNSHYSWAIDPFKNYTINKFYPIDNSQKNHSFFSIDGANNHFRKVVDYKTNNYQKEFDWQHARKGILGYDDNEFEAWLLDDYSKGMYEIIIRPFEKYLINSKKIIFHSIGDRFSQIPYSLLKSDENNDYFGHKYSIKNIISLNSLELRKHKKYYNSNLKFLGIGNPKLVENKIFANKNNFSDLVKNLFRGREIADRNILQKFEPLPQTEVELKTISKNFNSLDSKLLLGGDASEKIIKSMDLTEWDIINFSTHTINGYGLSEPGLILSLPDVSTSEDDGVLVASEVAQLNLNAKLVVLSACNTAAGKDTESEILSGLAQSFLYAGAENLILSHWPVEDRSTAILMSKFYDFWLKKNYDPADALKHAQIEVMQIPEYSHPIFWASFSYYGL